MGLMVGRRVGRQILLIPVSDSEHPVSDSEHPVSDSEHLVSDSEQLVTQRNPA